jgi:hypothetical protein
MLNFCHKLNSDLYPIKNFDISIVKHPHTQIDLKYLNPEFADWLLTFNLYISFMELYYKEVLTNKLQIHIDNEPGDYAKINYILGGKNSTMNWYELKKNINVDNQLIKTAGNTICTTVFDFQVNKIHEEGIFGLNLVQVGVPHDIYNPEEPRYCICCLLRDTITKERITMRDAETRFKKIII